MNTQISEGISISKTGAMVKIWDHKTEIQKHLDKIAL
jgi:hypothetical protein